MANTVQVTITESKTEDILPWLSTPRYNVTVETVGSDLIYGLSDPLPKTNAIGALNHLLNVCHDHEHFTFPTEIDE